MKMSTQEENVFSNAFFEDLFEVSPAKLLFLIRSGALTNAELTFAVEIVGRAGSDFSDEIRAVLVPLLDHESPVVREGAIYGVTRHKNDSVTAVLQRIAETDSYECLRKAAIEAIEE